VLEIGAYDLIQPTSTSYKVGRDPNYPDRRPWLAIEELWIRYLIPNLALQLKIQPITSETPITFDPEITFRSNREHLKAEIALIRQQRLPVFILFVPGYVQAMSATPPVPYKTEFLQLAQALKVPVIDLQPIWLALPPSTVAGYFRDELHFTVAGNRAIATTLFQAICQQNQPSVCTFH